MSLRDRKEYEWIKGKTKMVDMIQSSNTEIGMCRTPCARRQDSGWSIKLLLRNHSRGGPQAMWNNDGGRLQDLLGRGKCRIGKTERSRKEKVCVQKFLRQAEKIEGDSR